MKPVRIEFLRGYGRAEAVGVNGFRLGPKAGPWTVERDATVRDVETLLVAIADPSPEALHGLAMRSRLIAGLRDLRDLARVPGAHLPSPDVQAACAWIDELLGEVRDGG